MSRPLRVEYPNAWYHVTARGIDRRVIYRQDRDRGHWLELMGEFVQIYDLRVHGYVLMDNHYHLIVQTCAANLGRAMQWLQTSYSMWFNRKYKRVGPLFAGRYKAILVDAPTWGLALSRYVHLNPVRIGLLGLDKGSRQTARAGGGERPSEGVIRERIRRLAAHRWSSYRAYIGLEEPPAWLECGVILQLAGRGSLRQQQQFYRRHVEEAIREGLAESPWERLTGGMILGTKQLLLAASRQLKGSGREQPQRKALVPRGNWDRVVAAVVAARGLSWEQMGGRRGDWGRDLAWYLGRRECGLSLKALGAAAGHVDYATVSAAIKRMGRRLTDDRTLATQYRRAKSAIFEF